MLVVGHDGDRVGLVGANGGGKTTHESVGELEPFGRRCS